MYTIEFKYRRKRSWNCAKDFESVEEFLGWIELEKEVGNEVKEVSENHCIVMIDY